MAVLEYAFMGTNPNSPDNRWLLDTMQYQIPIIYFLGTSPGRYQPIIPTFIVGWHPDRLRVQLALGSWRPSAQAAPLTHPSGGMCCVRHSLPFAAYPRRRSWR